MILAVELIRGHDGVWGEYVLFVELPLVSTKSKYNKQFHKKYMYAPLLHAE
jgi:hypothetical protein